MIFFNCRRPVLISALLLLFSSHLIASAAAAEGGLTGIANPAPLSPAAVLTGAEEVAKETDKEGFNLDFKGVDLSVFARFVSEKTGKNFIVGDRVRGKVTVYSPEKISADRLYEFFLSVLDSRNLSVVESRMGKNLFEIVLSQDIKIKSRVHLYKLVNASAEELIKPLTALLAKAGAAKRKGRWSESEFEGRVSVVADKNSNSLFITATDKDYTIVKSLIEKLDLPEKQVFVEVVIMEVSSSKIDEVGVELRAANAFANLDKNKLMAVGGTNFGNISSASTVEGLNSIDGFAAGLLQGKFSFAGKDFLNVAALLRVLRTESDTNILSTPQILATDKKTAKIVVGENVPFKVGTSRAAAGSVIQEVIERKDVGIILEFTPRIIGDNKVQMKVLQKIDSVKSEAATADGITTAKRQIDTTIIADNFQTIVLGGLIIDDVNITENKVPFLGDIPYLGWLFKFKDSKVRKSNLLVFMTPFIINSSADLDMILDWKNTDIKSISEKNNNIMGQLLFEMLRKEAVNLPQ